MEVGGIPRAFSSFLCFVLNLQPLNFSGADAPKVKSPHGLWLFVLCQALSVSVKNAFPALHGALCVVLEVLQIQPGLGSTEGTPSP